MIILFLFVLKLFIFLLLLFDYSSNTRGVVANVLDSNINVNEFVLQPSYYAYFQTNQVHSYSLGEESNCLYKGFFFFYILRKKKV